MLRCSFYSYKGGAGRSTTAWNTIQRLVKIMEPTPEAPFVIVDTDTESAGATFLYKAKNPFFKDKDYASVQKRMLVKDDTNYRKASSEEKAKFFNGMYPVGDMFGLPEEKKTAVLLIGANLDKVSASAAIITGKDDKQMENFTSNITKACRACGAKALFFDTPSGTQYLARKSIQDSQIIVCCMRPTSQFREGTRDQLIDFVVSDQQLELDKTYILTPTAVCVDEGQDFDGATYPEQSKKEIFAQFSGKTIKIDDAFKEEEATIRNAVSARILLNMLEPTPNEDKVYKTAEAPDDNEKVFGIPEVRRFKWFERCLGANKDKLTPNDKMAINRYHYLAHTIYKQYKEKHCEE
jgi:MinD-like ATPase involved in chromosome partitioning or flagellar assembly